MQREVHPIAALFPMLAGEDLEELIADIRTNGLLQPIVLDAAGRVLDGRNRLAACERAGVEPRYTTYAGDDPDTYALSANLTRRHLNKGQRAMIAVMAYDFSETEKSSGDKGTLAQQAGVAFSRLSSAFTVLEHAPELVDAVIAGGSLDQAYRYARKHKEDKEFRASAQTPLVVEDVAEESLDDKIQELIALIGAATVIPDPPVTVTHDTVATALAEMVEPPPANSGLDAQHKFLQGLIGAVKTLERLADMEPVEHAWMSGGYALAIHSGVTHIVSAAYRIDQRHQQSTKQKVRLIK